MTPSVLGVIPARLGSTRLPRKPLHPILGRPLLEWVWNRTRSMELFDVLVVATDASEVADLCHDIGAPVHLTSSDHPSGTDRVAEVSRLPEYDSFEVVVNVQGDEPLVDERHLRKAVDLVGSRGGGWDVGTCATPLYHEDAWRNPALVKVVRACDGRALYFSRASIPAKRDGDVTVEELSKPPFLRHLGIYAYSRESLFRWVELPPSPLEQLERLEQLRPLEAGFRVGVAVVDHASAGVDTGEDVARVENELSGTGWASPNG